MGLLDGGISALFAELLSPLYLPATVYIGTPAYDRRGNRTNASAPRDCLAQVDRATESMRSDPEFSSTDRAVYVLAESLAGSLTTDCEIVVHSGAYAGTRWKVASPIDRDPGAAYWLGRAVLGKAAPGV